MKGVRRSVKKKKSLSRKKCSSSKYIKKISFSKVVKAIKKVLSNSQYKTLKEAINLALKFARTNKPKKPDRIIKVPKTGGVLPLIPIFAGLSALGALTGGASGIINALNASKTAKEQLKEAQRHNQTMESIAMGKGLFLKPYKRGLGIFLDQHQ